MDEEEVAVCPLCGELALIVFGEDPASYCPNGCDVNSLFPDPLQGDDVPVQQDV